MGLEFPKTAPVSWLGTEISDLEIPCVFGVDLVRGDLPHLLVFGLVDEQLPVLGVGGAFDFVLVRAVSFFPNETDALDVLRLAKVHL